MTKEQPLCQKSEFKDNRHMWDTRGGSGRYSTVSCSVCGLVCVTRWDGSWWRKVEQRIYLVEEDWKP